MQRGRPRGLCPRDSAVRCFTTHLCAASGAAGTRPLGFPSFGGGGGDGRLRPSPYLADTPFVVDRPPTHFFVKKKFSSIGGAESTTQKVPSVSCYAHAFCGGGTLCYARNPSPLRQKRSTREQEGSAAESLCGAGRTPQAGRELFSLRKKRTA